MNKAQKELIASCKPYVVGTPFRHLYVIPGGKLYNGFWGKNGYNKIYLVCGTANEEEHYLVGEEYQVDVLLFGALLSEKNPLFPLMCDVPHKLDCLHFWPSSIKQQFVIKEVLSSITLEEY